MFFGVGVFVGGANFGAQSAVFAVVEVDANHISLLVKNNGIVGANRPAESAIDAVFFVENEATRLPASGQIFLRIAGTRHGSAAGGKGFPARTRRHDLQGIC